jgi:hypothetical protein
VNYELDWLDDEKTIYWVKYMITLTWHDVLESTNKVEEVFASVEHPVYFIVDLRELNHLPLQGNIMTMKELFSRTPAPNLKLLFILGMNAPIVKGAVDIFMKSYMSNWLKQRIQFTDTMEETIAIITTDKEQRT